MNYIKYASPLLAVAAVSMVGAVAPAKPPVQAASPFIGKWELDTSRMPDTYGPAPKRVTYSFEDAGAGQWLTRIEIVAPDGNARTVVVRYRRDGKMVRGEGDQTDGDSAAFNSPAPNVLVMSVAKDKVFGSVRTYAVSPDGREMTESAAAVDGSGAPFVRNFHYKRIG